MFQSMVLLIIGCAAEPSLTPTVRVIAGAYWRPTPPSIAYESSLPLTFSVQWSPGIGVPGARAYSPSAVSIRDRRSISFDVNSPEPPLYQGTPRLEGGGNVVTSVEKEVTPVEKKVESDTVTANEHKSKMRKRSASPYDTVTITKTLAVTNRLFATELTKFEDMLAFEIQTTTPRRGKRSLEFLGNFLHWCCGVASARQFRGLKATDKQIRSESKQLEELLHTEHGFLSNLTLHLQQFEKDNAVALGTLSAQLHLVQKVVSMYMTRPSLNGHTLSVENILLEQVQQDLFHQFRLIDTIKHVDILTQCRRHLIPAAIVPVSTLRDHIQQLTTLINNQGLEFAIPLDEIVTYYKLPLAECLLSQGQLLVRIKVPLRQAGQEWEVFEFVPLPFAWKGETCQLFHEPAMLAKRGNESRVITGTNLADCEPRESQLCYVPRFSSAAVFGSSCADAMVVNMTVSAIAESCLLRCQTGTSMRIGELTHEMYVVTQPVYPLEIKCEKSNSTIRRQPNGLPGALLMTIPCACELWAGDRKMIPRQFPCDIGKSPLHVVRVIPAAWTHLDSLSLDSFKLHLNPSFQKLADCLNQNWTLMAPHLNITPPTATIEWIKRESTGQTVFDRTDVGINLYLLWNIALTLVVGYLAIKAHPIFMAKYLPSVHGETGAQEMIADVLAGVFITAVAVIAVWVIWKIARSAQLILRRQLASARTHRQRRYTRPPPTEITAETLKGLTSGYLYTQDGTLRSVEVTGGDTVPVTPVVAARSVAPGTVTAARA